MPTTSQPSVGDFLAAYEPLLDAGHDVVSIHLSGAVSGTYGSALQARAAARRARVRRSRRGARLAQRRRRPGPRCDRRGDEGARRRRRCRTSRSTPTRAAAQARIWFCLDTLEYLRRGGRVGGAQAWVGGALKIKPILTVDGEIKPVERVRTRGKAFERMVEHLATLHADGVDGWLVQHIQAPDEAQRLVEQGREIFGTEPLFVSEVGPVLGVYLGPGMIGVAGIPTAALR